MKVRKLRRPIEGDLDVFSYAACLEVVGERVDERVYGGVCSWLYARFNPVIHVVCLQAQAEGVGEL